VRAILDGGGLTNTTIFASGNLDEWTLRNLLARQAPIDGFGIGTKLDVCADAPYLDCAYKLQEYAGVPRRKCSEGKATWPGRKQVYRRHDGSQMAADVIAVESDPQPGQPLLEPVMRNGTRTAPQPPLTRLREQAREKRSQIPERLQSLSRADLYPVEIARSLIEMAKSVDDLTRG